MVAVEDGARPVARDGHGDPLRHPRGNEVPHGRPPEVVPDGARHASAPAGRPPGLPEVADRVAYEARRLASLVNEQLGDDLPEPVLQLHAPPGPPAWPSARGLGTRSRPSSFFVVPGFRRSVPASRSSCASVKDRTSDYVLHLYVWAMVTAGLRSSGRCRRIASY